MSGIRIRRPAPAAIFVLSLALAAGARVAVVLSRTGAWFSLETVDAGLRTATHEVHAVVVNVFGRGVFDRISIRGIEGDVEVLGTSCIERVSAPGRISFVVSMPRRSRARIAVEGERESTVAKREALLTAGPGN